ncbi:mucin-1 isoform 12 precursor [Homo sapiens]|uniref:Mucin-1 n=1 Tax=Homo sapiens TaxID=9606 RepID=A5YRU7_HUMAN|nr:mucin-1 isoform 12 precursor [Homo sapiens]ABQ59624.1 MUC1 isoform T7 [Homo sapiens]|eukprot:NP_001191217.1 mucin-1 isoform 12 precursor [Homo sapiens]
MTPGTQSPFFLLLLLTVLTATTAPKPATVVTGSGHASSTPGGEKETSATQRSSVPSSTEKNAFNSSLEDPSTDYYQELQRDISEMFLQIYKQGGFLGLSNIKFRPGSVVVQLTLAFREGTINVHDVETQFNQYKTEAASRYNLTISDVSVWGWGARLGHRAAGAGLCSGCAGHCLSHCLGCLSVPPKELRAAGHLSSPGYLPSYERVPHLPHPWALCAP